MKAYNTIYEGGTDEIVEKKSRFIAQVFPVETEEEVATILEQMKKNGVQVFTYSETELLPLRRAIAENWKNLEPVMGRQLMNDARKHFLINVKH